MSVPLFPDFRSRSATSPVLPSGVTNGNWLPVPACQFPLVGCFLLGNCFPLPCPLSLSVLPNSLLLCLCPLRLSLSSLPNALSQASVRGDTVGLVHTDGLVGSGFSGFDPLGVGWGCANRWH